MIAEVVEPDVGTVIGAARAGNLHMVVVGIDFMVDTLGQGFCIVAAEGAEFLTRTGNDVPCS